MSSTTRQVPKIEIRPVNTAERPALVELEAYSHNAPGSEVTEWLTAMEGEVVYGLFEGGKLVAALKDGRFDIWMDGRLVKANGVGEVATLPTARHKGYARRLMADNLSRLKADGVLYSLLYPFRNDYYRRMGWGPGPRTSEFKVPIGEFRAFGRETGRMRLLLWGDKGELHPAEGETEESVISKLRPVYEASVVSYNLPARRDDHLWKRMLMSSGRYVFAWQDEGGTVQGYVAVRNPAEPVEHMSIREMHAATPDAWRGLLCFVHSHAAQHSHVRMPIPPEHPVLDLLSDPHEFEVRYWSMGPMARVVDVPAALAEKLAARRNRGAGPEGAAASASEGCAITVKDELAPWNDGTWSVGPKGVAPAAKPAAGGPATAEPVTADLEMEMDVFSMLCCGARSVDDLMAFGLSKGRPGPGLGYAKQLFQKRPLWHTEYY